MASRSCWLAWRDCQDGALGCWLARLDRNADANDDAYSSEALAVAPAPADALLAALRVDDLELSWGGSVAPRCMALRPAGRVGHPVVSKARRSATGHPFLVCRECSALQRRQAARSGPHSLAGLGGIPSDDGLGLAFASGRLKGCPVGPLPLGCRGDAIRRDAQHGQDQLRAVDQGRLDRDFARQQLVCCAMAPGRVQQY